jgi:DNA-binding response OmpR family regulator
MAVRTIRAATRVGTTQASVLVVEDERAIRDLLRLHLCNAGHGVMLAEDAIEAGRRLLERSAAIDLIIVDAQLPYLSGIEFVSTLIADSTLPPRPIILITGHEDLALRAQLLDVPCLMKPFSAETLLALVERCLAGTRAHSAAGFEQRKARANG